MRRTDAGRYDRVQHASLPARANHVLMRPSTSTILGIAGVIALLVVSTIVGSIVILGMGGQASAEAERQIRHAIAVDDAALHAKGIANDERGFLLSGNEQFLGTITARTELARLAFEEAVRTADDGQRPDIALAQEGFEAWIDAVSGTLAMYRAGNNEEAVAQSLGRARELRLEYEDALIQADAHAVGTMRSARGSTETTWSWSVGVLIGYMLIVIAIGVALAVAVLRRAGSERPLAVPQHDMDPPA
jgi:methyl-accepting chemotaxis protein